MLMQLPKLPNYNISVREFNELELPMSDRLMELLEQAREETVAAMKGKVPLDQVTGLPRERLGPATAEQLRER